MSAFDPKQKSQTKTIRTLTGHQPANPGIRVRISWARHYIIQAMGRSHQLVGAAYVSCDDGDRFGPCGHQTSKRPIRRLTVPY